MPTSPHIIAAPHRTWFFLGLASAVVSVAWWLVFWVVLHAAPAHIAMPPVPPGHAHGLLMTHGLFGFFTWGFLTTVFPRWQQQPAVARAAWLPGPVVAAVGYLVVLAGLLLGRTVLAGGVVLLALAHALATLPLVRVFVAAGEHRALHAWVALVGLIAGQLALLAYAWGVVQGDGAWTGGALDASVWLYLLPVYATVGHRMIPFFSRCVYPDYEMRRPWWPLAALVLGGAGHAAAGWLGVPAWAWIPDVLAALGAGWLAVAWQPWRCLRPTLLASLHLGWAWLPLALLLSAVQRLGLLVTGELVAPRAPLHALTIGVFGTLLIAMVTRVTLGHSGRALEMSRTAWALVWVMQLVAVVRIAAELLMGGPGGWHANATAAALWLVVMLVWGGIHGPMYWRARVDGKPG